MKGLRLLAVAVILGGLVSLVIGIVFIVQSVSVKAEITEGLAAEGQTSQLPEEGEEGYFEGNVVDTAGEAEVVVEYLLGHLHHIGETDGTTTYANLERGSEERATYLDGFSLVTGLNLAVMGFGVAQIALAAGVVMITTGLSLGAAGFVVYRLDGKKS
jgi:hypothetical protein